jgi:hypothetical protein
MQHKCSYLNFKNEKGSQSFMTFSYFRNGPLWLVVMANAIPAGIYGVWGSELDIILDPVGIGQVCCRYIWISKNEI